MADLTFGQANGLEPLPTQAQIGTISQETVARLWHLIHLWLNHGVYGTSPDQKVREVLTFWWTNDMHRMVDEAPIRTSEWQGLLKAEIQGGFLRAYNLIQALLRYGSFAYKAKEIIADILEDTRAAYRLVDGNIIPFATQEEHDQIVLAVNSSAKIGAIGARAHLLNAGAALTSGDWALAIQECMASVEAAARFVSGDHSKELGPILSNLRSSGVITHGALAEALKKLYGYTSDEQGIRHSLVLTDEANVTEREAFLMLGLCASFVTYLLGLASDRVSS